MLYFPNAKINLGLNIVSKRPDNYHNLETVFYPIELQDALEVVPAQREGGGYRLHLSGITVDGKPEDNLIIKAWQLLDNEYHLPAIDIFMHKAIPFGAGLGGGSADAAFMLKLLRDLFELPIAADRLEQLATKLGADCPFFLRNTPVLAHGIGNEFTPIELSLKGYSIVLVKPPVHVSTAEAYALVTPAPAAIPVAEAIQLPVAEWRNHLVNDFEQSVFARHPQIEQVKEILYSQGAVYAAMSGSGSSVFGLFEGDTPPTLSPELGFVWQGKLR